MINPWKFIGQPCRVYEEIVPGDAIVPGTIIAFCSTELHPSVRTMTLITMQRLQINVPMLFCGGKVFLCPGLKSRPGGI